mmetsp:Transcript_115758/g.236667  ORF Transcript_115758/g.236667 Transcript_115758/m.236667 type:complete len:94 (-) Transcript_115758:1419-1700(-)
MKQKIPTIPRPGDIPPHKTRDRRVSEWLSGTLWQQHENICLEDGCGRSRLDDGILQTNRFVQDTNTGARDRSLQPSLQRNVHTTTATKTKVDG